MTTHENAILVLTLLGASLYALSAYWILTASLALRRHINRRLEATPDPPQRVNNPTTALSGTGLTRARTEPATPPDEPIIRWYIAPPNEIEDPRVHLTYIHGSGHRKLRARGTPAALNRLEHDHSLVRERL